MSKCCRFLVLCLFAVSLGMVSADVPVEDVDHITTAREKYQVAVAVRDRIAKDLESIKADPATPPEKIREFERYLARAEALVEAHKKLVDAMHATTGSPAPSIDLGPPGELEPGIPSADDELAALEREFNSSLTKFDGMLLDRMDRLAKELEELEASSSDSMSSLEQAAAAARERLESQSGKGEGSKGESASTGKQASPAGGSGSGESEGAFEEGTAPDGEGAEVAGGATGAQGSESGAEGATGEAGTEGAMAGGPKGTEGAEGESGEAAPGESGSKAGMEGEVAGGPGQSGKPGEAGGPTGTGKGQGGTAAEHAGSETAGKPGEGGEGVASETENGRPAGVGDGHDDDIVARQLREAAEKETDPELKAKLWKEYQDYTDATRQ